MFLMLRALAPPVVMFQIKKIMKANEKITSDADPMWYLKYGCCFCLAIFLKKFFKNCFHSVLKAFITVTVMFPQQVSQYLCRDA